MSTLSRLKWLFAAAFCAGIPFAALAADAPAVKLMFGARTEQPQLTRFSDFVFVTPDAKFEDGKPWGWTDTKKVTGWTCNNDRGCSNPMDGLLEHCVRCYDGAFAVRVPNGKALVHLWIGDTFQSLRNTMASYRVTAEGKPVVDEKITFGNIHSERWWLRGQSEVYHKGLDRWARQVKPILDEYDFEVAVADGVLHLGMKNVNLCALIVLPAGDAATMKSILSAVEQERRAQFDKRYPWKPQPDEPMPAARALDEQRGFVLFQKLIDDNVYPWTRPTAAEITDTFRFFAAQGEQEAARFGAVPLKEMRQLSVEVGDFSGPNGAKIATAACGDLWMERYTELGSQGTSGKGGNLDPLSDVLLEVRPFDCEPGTPRMYTLDLRVPKDAPPGFYRAPVSFRIEGREIAKADLLLRVLPWELAFAPVPYSFQPTYRDWSDLIREGYDKAAVRRFVEARIRFIGKYGFSASYFYPSPLEPWGAIKGEPGSRRLTQTPQQAEEMDWWYQTVMKQGNANQWIQFHVLDMITSRLGWYPFDFQKKIMEEKSEPDRRDLVQIVRDYEEIVRKKGYPKHYYYCAGEPDNGGLPMVERENEMAKICREAGGQTLCTLNGPIGAKLCPLYHDIVCANHGTPITDEFIAYVESKGDKFGSHNTGDSRLAGGYQFWRMRGVTKFQEGTLYVGYMVPFAYLPWNYRAAAAFPQEDGGWRPTVRWLRYRDGRDDFMYLWNLEQRLAKAKADGRGLAPAAREADEFLKTMRERISVDPREYFAEQMDAKEAGSGVTVGWTAKRFDRYRWLVARMIMGLDETLAK